MYTGLHIMGNIITVMNVVLWHMRIIRVLGNRPITSPGFVVLSVMDFEDTSIRKQVHPQHFLFMRQTNIF